ncbi:MAG: hypothetical protein O2856_03545 [Planctomycetota bacterium]|nr:hypothetical protein [Planctomycetota bacterium]
MKRFVVASLLIIFSVVSVEASVLPSKTDDASSRNTTSSAFGRMSADQIKERLQQWLTLSRTDIATTQQAMKLWADRQQIDGLTAEQTLDRLIDSFAIADKSVQQLVELCRSTGTRKAMDFEGPRSDDFFRNQVILYHARWLTQHRFYDEALLMLESLDPETVVDPASLFFYRAVCRLRLLKPAEAGDDITLLLNNTLDVPSRFRAVAEMMKEEAKVATEGLPQVARLMFDVQRRLDLGYSDDPVQKRQGEVIAALDKLLEEMEKQEQKQQQQGDGQGQGRQNQPGAQGATQSTIKGATAEGDADRKDLTENGSWGMLDKQAETKARELIRQQFPPNFLDAISRYTRRIAEQKK